MRETIERPDALVDVTGLSTTIEETRDGGLLIGAARAQHRAGRASRRCATRYPMLARAILAGAQRADPQHGDGRRQSAPAHALHLFLRRRRLALQQARSRAQGCDAIDGFNRIHAILGASPACVATHPSDMCVALAALDAIVHLAGAGRHAHAAARPIFTACPAIIPRSRRCWSPAS